MHYRLKPLAAALAVTGAMGALGALTLPGAAFAANHALSAEKHDAAASVTTVDVTIGLDFDPDNATPAERNRQYVTRIVEEFGKALYSMTNGLKRLGTVRVYSKGRFLDNVDAQILNKDGRAHASINGWRTRGLTATQYASMDNKVESEVQIGKTIAHEWGHYALGLYDEYVEANSKSTDPTSPQANDTPRNTIMNNHEEFPGLSRPSDYPDASTQKTAHFRAYGKSAWETLIADPATDSATAKPDGVPKRTWWQAFRNASPAVFGSRDSTGYNAAMKIVFMPDNTSKQVLLIDRRLPEALFDAAKKAAQQALRKVDVGARVQVMDFPASGAAGELTVMDEAHRNTLLAQVNALTRTDASADIDATLRAALAVLQAGRTETDTPGIILFTVNSTEPAQAVLNEYTAAQVSIQPVTVDTPAAAASQYKRGAEQGVQLRKAAAGKVLLRDIAEKTGAVYRHANNPAEMISMGGQSTAGSQGTQEAALASGEFAAMASGGVASANFQLARGVDGLAAVAVYGTPADIANTQLRLVSPAGVRYQAPFPAGFTYVDDSAEGSKTVEIAASVEGREGRWTLEAAASGGKVGALEYEVTSQTQLMALPDRSGGEDADPRPLTLTLSLRGPQPVAGATVTVDLYTDSGQQLYATLPMQDDGVGGDRHANDGIYTLNIGNGLKQGEYNAVFRVTNPDGTAQTTTSGSLRKGTDSAAVTLGKFERSTEYYFANELATTPPALPAQKVVVEYRNKPFDYYFITSTDADKKVLDGLADWERTGQSFPVLSAASFGAGAITRYYFDKIAMNGARGSHFYTVWDGEQKALGKLNPTNASTPRLPVREGVEGYVYYPVMRDGKGASCLDTQVAIYRVFRGNARFPDNPNHRYTTSRATYDQMVSAGWDGEGVAFCAPK